MTSATAAPQGRAAIADALHAIWRIVEDRHPGRDDPDGLRQLIEAFLAVCPAPSLAHLEQRLLDLATSLDALGPLASEAEVIAEAVRRAGRAH